MLMGESSIWLCTWFVLWWTPSNRLSICIWKWSNMVFIYVYKWSNLVSICVCKWCNMLSKFIFKLSNLWLIWMLKLFNPSCNSWKPICIWKWSNMKQIFHHDKLFQTLMDQIILKCKFMLLKLGQIHDLRWLNFSGIKLCGIMNYLALLAKKLCLVLSTPNFVRANKIIFLKKKRKNIKVEL